MESAAMVGKKNKKRVVLFASIEEEQHEALRYIAFREKRSMADVAREAIDQYIARKSRQHKLRPLATGDEETVEVRRASG